MCILPFLDSSILCWNSIFEALQLLMRRSFVSSMGSSVLLFRCANCTILPCPCIGQHYHLSSRCVSPLTFSRHLYISGFGESSTSRRGSGFRGDSVAAFSRRSLKLSGSSRLSCDIFQSRTQLLRFNVGVTVGTRKYVRRLTTVSTKEREWQEFDAALQHKDVAGALEVLDVLNSFEAVTMRLPAAGSSPGSMDVEPAGSRIGHRQTVDDLEILDALDMTSDLVQLGKGYEWLLSKGFLPNFGKNKVNAFEGDRLVTEAVLMDTIGLKASKLSPQKWGFSGKSAIALPIGIALFSYLRDSGVDVRPVACLVLALSFYDAIYLGGTGLMQIFSMWVPYRRRVLVHEAGHVLVAYLVGCPIRGVILDPVQALKLGIHGQAGTQFWDQTLEMEFSQVGLASLTMDRYSVVLFAGIAAEALIYGEVQGGESDENLFKSVVGQLQPSWSPAKMSDHARWAVLKAFQLLRNHKAAHAAVVQALEQEVGLGSLIRAIEETMS